LAGIDGKFKPSAVSEKLGRYSVETRGRIQRWYGGKTVAHIVAARL